MQTVSVQTGRDLWRERVSATPDRPYVVCAGETTTFAGVDERVLRMAGGLASQGVGQGTRVLLGVENSLQALVIHIAVRELGAVLVPLMPGLAPAEHVYQVNHCEATVLIADASVADGLLPLLGDCPAVSVLILDGDVTGRPDGAVDLAALAANDPIEPGRELPNYDDRSPAMIVYTSGSTGRPKGVVIPAGAMPSAGRGFADRFEITEDDTFFLPLPMAHGVGGITAQGITMSLGCRIAIEQRFRPSKFWDQIEATGSTVSILFPAQCNLLVETGDSGPAKGASSLRLVITHMFLPAFDERFGVGLGLCWGMTETGATSTGSPPGYRGERGDGYVGSAMLGVDVAIMDGDGVPVPDGADGEICLRHVHIMLEYLKDPVNTAATVRDGWVRSGDRGSLAEDGALFYRGRFKNMIKRSGENISAEEVEAVLDQHPAVAESLVIGVPDALRTEEVAARVVVRAGQAVEPEELIRYVGAQLARWKAPRYIEITSTDLPRLGNGKLDRQRVIAELDPGACWDRAAVSSAG